MKKILIVATGGTIACSDSGDGLSPKYDVNELLEYIPHVLDLCKIGGELIMNIDSSNMNPSRWKCIAQKIYENYENYDGFVVTHGTDTMAYTSAALTYMLQNMDKPVIITGSQYSIEESGSDAIQNLSDAILFALEDIAGVFVAFDGKLINGTRAMKVKTRSFDAFESVNFPDIATIKYGKIIYNKSILGFYKKHGQQMEFADSICEKIMVLKLFPGINPDIFDYIKNICRGVIIESFGIGGIPFENFDITSKVKELIDEGIAVVVTTQCMEEGVDLNIYEVGKKLSQNNIIFARDMNTEALVPKLMWALGMSKDMGEVKKYIETSFKGDITIETAVLNELQIAK
ncbi:L-asparaginase [Peptoclostridium litorale DSM 5388]|uniref:asparaginase n=1 Tax=Peptoclostridium litorale DSM 5388 TaxID=1121324 RepID=A0A069RD35_PEPLI|nr:asparaginase [Peptoclostridium litorale]KDR94984.1 L-asparaginase 1 [Peptoclostridium litorale DSM 5388]SIN77055.1 L-asparaginase [Peptoclostridium litorale DSM 5388]